MNACSTSGKVRYPSPQAAHRALTHLERRKGGRRAGSRKAATAYQCSWCRDWHVTTGRRK